MRSKWINRVLSVALLFTTLTASVSYTFTTAYAEEAGASTQQSAQSGVSWPEAPEISAGNGILIDADTGAILYEKNAYTKCYPASTTKILTGLLTVENCSMDETVTFSRAAANSVTWEDSNLATKVGEQYTVEQALYGLLLYSANEIAYGLAEHVGGSLENFVEMMNARARELGAVNTHFANASGLYDPNHYTTAYDMAMIARGCYNNSTFVNIDSTEDTYTIGPTNLTGESRTFRHRHQMLKGRPMYYEYCKGGKTGFTDQSGFTLVTFAEKNDMRLICVVFNCSDSNIRFTDTRTLFDWGFDNFKKITASSDTISSYFSGSNYYQSAVYSRYPENFSLSASTLTIPNHANVSDITLAVNQNYTPEEIDNAYTTGIRFKYGDNTVATSLLTFSKGTAHTDNRLPYLSQDADTETIQPRWCFSISIWVIVAVFAAVVILICFIRDYQMSRRRSLHARRHHRRRR